MVKISEENVVFLQQAYSLLEAVETKGHANHAALVAAMDRVRAVFDACQESMNRAEELRAKGKKDVAGDKEV